MQASISEGRPKRRGVAVVALVALIAVVAVVGLILVSQRDSEPNLGAAVEEAFSGTGVVSSGDEESATVVIMDTDVDEGGPALAELLDDLGFTSATLDRMGNTRALDGTQSAEGDGVNATWTYHPDDGLQIVFEETQ